MGAGHTVKILPTIALTCAALALAAPRDGRAAASAYVDDHGVLRWTASGQEIVQFGVNYTAPFAFSFRAHARLGIPITKAIDADVYHLSRMGLDAYRVHVWDQQISDARGNVLNNEHLAALDYLIARLEERGFKIILTPLLFGDAGYPETRVPAEEGFSSRYGKKGCLEDRSSWPLQERYLSQFVSHVNSVTGRALKDDDALIGFEVCNEPGHFEYGPTLEYINAMVAAIRGAGCEKPVFYNMSHGMPVVQAYLDSRAQGGTFQWYPSCLMAGHEQFGNFLPYVDRYPIPFAGDPKFQGKARIVYEFDSADIGRSYIYPAMARSFRTAGMQFATQFAYDPLYLAPYNIEYQTHYLNLAYSPQKALSMKVAAEAFRRVPRFRSYGPYPEDTQFEGVRISYERDLAELATREKFFYTNDTPDAPPSPAALEQVAGYGSSPVVDYPGAGAYFLDRVQPGVWRLEVMPDAVWTGDPFAKASPKRQVCRIAWDAWPITIRLPDLGPGYSVAGLNDGNARAAVARDGRFVVSPGAYLLVRAGTRAAVGREDSLGHIRLKEFVAPPASVDQVYVLHSPSVEATAGTDLPIEATIVAPGPVTRATLVVYAPRNAEHAQPVPPSDPRKQPGGGIILGPGAPESAAALEIPMSASGLRFRAVIPGADLFPGTLRYFIVVQGPKGAETFPPRFQGSPGDWDFYGSPWQCRMVPAGAPILLFSAAADTEQITYQDRQRRYSLVPSGEPGSTALNFVSATLGEAEHDESFRSYFANRAAWRSGDLRAKGSLVLYGRSATGGETPVQLALVTSDGIAYGATVRVGPAFGRYSIPVGSLHRVRSPNIPRGYPVFIPYWSDVKADIPLDLAHAESVLVSLGPGLSEVDYTSVHGVQIERIWLE